jgi:Fe-S oxidoreductase
MELNFDPDICFGCDSHACLANCQYLDFDFEKIRQEVFKIARGDYSEVLEICATCYACEEYCPYSNHPFYRIVELQEIYGIELASKEVLEELIRRYEPQGEFRPREITGKALNLCLFPEFKNMIRGRLFENMTVVRGRHIFCNLIFLHFARISVIKEKSGMVIGNISSYGDEIVMYHDECYGFYNSFAKAYGLSVPFKPVHLFEHLYNRLKQMETEIQKLNIRVAYQRPCSNRLSPETDNILDKIFELTGVERVEREYDRKNALCCGASFVFQRREELAKKVQEKNLKDMVSSGASHVVFNCPMCYLTLAEKVKREGMVPIMVSELCKMAIGEEPVFLK